ELALVVGIDQAHEIAEYHAVFVAEPGARQDHRGKARIVEVDGESGGNQFCLAGRKRQWRVQAGTQVEPRGSSRRIGRQWKFGADARIEDPDLEGAFGVDRRHYGIHAVILASLNDFRSPYRSAI